MQQQDLPFFALHFLKRISGGQKPVKADCIRFTPTNAVSNNHHGLTQCANEMLIKTIVPAKTRILCSIVILFPISTLRHPSIEPLNEERLQKKDAVGDMSSLNLHILLYRKPLSLSTHIDAQGETSADVMHLGKLDRPSAPVVNNMA